MYSALFNDLFDLNQEMNKLFNNTEYRTVRWPESNLYENQDEYVIIAKVPGVNKEDINVVIKDNALSITGKRNKKMEKNIKKHLDERFSGDFERHFLLNEKIDSEKIEAETDNGLLMIKLPKSQETKPRKIEIK